MVYKSLLNFFLKTNCPLCDRPTDRALCVYCQRQLQHCQLHDPSQLWQPPLPIFAWGEYGGILKRAIAQMKYENHPHLAQPLADELGRAWLQARVSRQATPIVVPIPMHARKRQQRGFDQAELLARHFCQTTGLPLQTRGLERVRSTQALFELSPVQRQQEVAEAFILGRGFRRRPTRAVLLLDDIYTTGATARSAAKTLQQQEITVLGMVAIATPTRSELTENLGYKPRPC
jgi:ComF family protein